MKKIIEIRKELAETRTTYIQAMADYYTSEAEDLQALEIDKATNALAKIEALEIDEMDAIREYGLATAVAEKKYSTLANAMKKLLKDH